MRVQKALRVLFLPVVIVAVCATTYLTRDRWLPLLKPVEAVADSSSEGTSAPVEKTEILELSEQARKNLQLVARPARTQSYWKKVQIPSVIVDRPGKSDRGITSPVVGVVTQIHAFPGDTVQTGDRLFSLRLFSEYLQKTQKELFEATREIQLLQEELERLKPLADSGAIPALQMIELKNEQRRQAASIEAHHQDLLTRGLHPDEIKKVEAGQFVSTIDVVTPEPLMDRLTASPTEQTAFPPVENADIQLAYEVQELAVELGQQVQAGQLLTTLANHRSLYIEGHAFKREAPALENAAQNGWKITVEFAEDDPDHWPPLENTFQIRHLSNSIDVASRTFDFFIPLENQSRSYMSEGETFVVWRFRPGQRVRLYVPVEKLENVFVLPAESVVREGPEAYVFRQNGDLFNRIAVQVLHEDRLNVVLANDGSIKPGLYFAQNAAASLNRVLKAQASSGMQPGVHVHADGTVHAAH